MRNSSGLVSWKTYGLAFAIALSPALMQTEPSCAQEGDTTLSAFQFRVLSQNHIDFDSGQRVYHVWLPSIADTADVVAYSTDTTAEVTYEYRDTAGALIDAGWFSSFIGGGTMTLDGLLPQGESVLRIFVKTPGTTAARNYTAVIRVGCSDCDDGIACTQDACDPTVEACVHPAEPGGTACDAGGIPGICVDTTCAAFCSVTTCDDGNVCTADSCDAAAGTCTHMPLDGAPCANGEGACRGDTCVRMFTCNEQGIRDAIAVGGGPHAFDCVGPTTVVTAAEIVIDNDVVLDGDGLLTIDARGGHRVLSVPLGVTADLYGMTISAGNTAGCGGGILNAGTLNVTDSAITGNTAEQGGGVCNSGMLLLNRSVLSGNSATLGGGANVGLGALTLINSTVSGNAASLVGGGIFSGDGTVIAYYSTIAANSANPEAPSGAICAGDGRVSLTKTLIEGACGCTGLPSSNGYNIESPADTCGLTHPTDQPAVPTGALMLGPLQDNGGPTLSHLPEEDSVAIDAVPPEECFPGTTDQRDLPRPQGSGCEVGAVEFGPADSEFPPVFNEAAWEITGNGVEPISGIIDISAPGSEASVEVFGLPPGMGYSIEMLATSEGWAVPCVGSSDFGVEEGQSTDVSVMLSCESGLPPLRGHARLGGSHDSCAQLAQVVVSPLQTSVGNVIDLFADAVDDGVGDPIEYLWTSTGGSVDNPTAPLTLYTCEQVGDQAITITVSDEAGICHWTVPVTCVDGRGGCCE